MSEMTEEEINQLTPKKVAFIIDGEVVDIVGTDERLAAIFLSQPTMVDVTGPDGSSTTDIGYSYDQITGEFREPKPYESWIFDQERSRWRAPVEFPIDGRSYTWDEETISWNLQS
jgi:hypothetical protein